MIMSTKKVIFGSFIGTLLALSLSSTYFFTFFKKVSRRLREDFKEWDDLKKF